MELRDWQIGLRQQYGEKQEFELTNEGDHRVWSDFFVHNAERNSNYRVAIRGAESGHHNYCSCMDYRTNALGTCKHIEWTLHKLKNTHGNKQHFKKPPIERAYTSVYLHYGEERTLRIRIGSDNKEKYEKLAKKYFDERGVLYPHAWLDFDKFLAESKEN